MGALSRTSQARTVQEVLSTLTRMLQSTGARCLVAWVEDASRAWWAQAFGSSCGGTYSFERFGVSFGGAHGNRPGQTGRHGT